MANQPRLATESLAGLRPYQEDSVLAERLPDGRVLLAVADGMGGHAAGEVASALALHALREAVRRGDDLRAAFALANERVYGEAAAPGRRGMGTTLVAAVIDRDRCTLGNVGDSRGYLISARGIRRLTTDHSFVAEAMARGQSEHEAMASPYKEYLTRAIGIEPSVEVDIYGPLPMEAGTALVLCSDGLYKSLDDEELHALYLQSSGVRAAARALAAAAIQAGSDDNVSVVIAEFGEVARKATGTMPLEYDPPPDEADEADDEDADEADDAREVHEADDAHEAAGPSGTDLARDAPSKAADAPEAALIDVVGVAPGSPDGLPNGVMVAVGLAALAVAALLIGLGWVGALAITLLVVVLYRLSRR